MSEPAGLDIATLQKIKSILLSELEAKLHYVLFVFGSRATSQFRKYSDLDLWIESSPRLTARELSDLHEKFEESDLAIKVDLVTPENCLPVYLPQIGSEKKLWFEKGSV
ncbi:MAG: nucleotidyltransferase domain-containing protein [Bdellovibrionaceae bacterium]|nr:nucleotidyltransferase domain-containing protein [Pseudobdellovibrionaceae bacterium]